MSYPYPGQQEPQPQQRGSGLGKKFAIGCGGIVGAMILFASCMAIVSSGSGDNEPDAPDSSSVSESAKTVEPDEPTDETTAPSGDGGDAASFGDGDYEVGVDIEPGTYVSKGAKKGLIEFCSASTKTADGNYNEMESANADEQVILKVTSADSVVSISGCESFVRR